MGLIGGSLALAARERGLVERVVGYGRNERTLRRAKKIGILDAWFPRPEEFPEDADFLVLATPVSAIAPLTRVVPAAPGTRVASSATSAA